MEKKKILMVMLEAGAGHKMPALAVKYSIEKLFPGEYQIDVVDLPEAAGAKSTGDAFKKVWNEALAHKGLATFGYSLMQALHPLSHLYLPIAHRKFIKKSTQYIKEYNPDIIFATHYFMLTASAIAKKKLKLKAKVIGFVTDPFDGFSFWAENRADYICCASDESRERLVRHGVNPDKIRVFPFPLNDKFLTAQTKKKELSGQYNIDPSMKTVLASDGGQGIGRVTKYIEEMYRRDFPLNIILVCGKNEEAKNRIESLVRERPSRTRLIPLGYVTNMNELLDLCDFTVIKAGASTSFESLIKRKPIIYSSWAIQSERTTIDYVVANKMGWFPRHRKSFFKLIHQLISTPLLEEYTQHIIDHNIRSGSDDLARFIVE
jgi:UDP-N-acetylglucosamine:LPS N-acetylglucosamine transferase